MEPVIVVGMHRSGTTLVSKLLQRIGVLMGEDQDENHEARFFQRLNVWLLESAGARWDLPSAWRWAIADDEVRRRYVEYVRIMLRSPRAAGYFGPRRYLRGARFDRTSEPWGWKDPRSTVTLPVWLDAFGSRARVVHIRRHGVDVARSLVVRHGRMRERRLAQFDRMTRWHALYWVRPKRGEFVDSARCTTLEGAFSLWVEYGRLFESMRAVLPVPVLDVTYEALLQDPAGQLGRIARHCGVDADESRLAAACQDVQRERAFAYRLSAEDDGFARSHNDRLAELGYGGAD